MHTHTCTDRMAVPWSMSSWAGLKRRHILEACRSSLMSNLPHQKTFIPINKAFGKGALHRLSAVHAALCVTEALCVHSTVDMLVCVHSTCHMQGFHLRLCTNRKRGMLFFNYFFQCWCLRMHFACITSSSNVHELMVGVFFWCFCSAWALWQMRLIVTFMHVCHWWIQTGKNKMHSYASYGGHSSLPLSWGTQKRQISKTRTEQPC